MSAFPPSQSSPAFRLEAMSALAGAAAMGLIWQAPARPAPPAAEMVCPAGDHVSFDQVQHARARARVADAAWREATGSRFFAAKAGFAPGSEGHRAAEAAAAEREAAYAALARICGLS